MTATQSPTKEGFDEVHENKPHAIWLFKNSHDCLIHSVFRKLCGHEWFKTEVDRVLMTFFVDAEVWRS